MDVQPGIDLAPVFEPLREIIITIIVGILVEVARRVMLWVGLKNTEKYQATILRAAETAAALAVENITKRSGTGQSYTTGKPNVYEAITYMLTTVPGTLKKLGIIDSSGKVTEKLHALAEGQLAKYTQKPPVMSIEPKS